MKPPVLDGLQRPLRSLRISVTDRCNLRCHYCMPEDEYVWLPRASLLTFEELYTLALSSADVGVRKLRITGGEPLLRKDLPQFVSMLSAAERFDDIALTTNGLLLPRAADALKQAGLQRVTLSLDTLQPDRFTRYSRGARLEDVFKGLDALASAGFTGTKINSVLTRGTNDDEIVPLFEFASARGAQIRYIEYMDVGGATDWSMSKVVTQDEVLAAFRNEYGDVTQEPNTADPSAPARTFRLPDGRTFGIVASTTRPFCRDCDRARLTADGHFFTCLYSDQGTDLRTPLREGAAAEDLTEVIRGIWAGRQDRGAEERAEMPSRGALYQIDGLRSKPHREMHTRGG